MKEFDNNAPYSDEEFQEFFDTTLIPEEAKKKLEQFVKFTIGDPAVAPPFSYETLKKEAEEYCNSIPTIKLPCGCSTNQVSRWTEAMFHLLFPDRCPTQSKKEKTNTE